MEAASMTFHGDYKKRCLLTIMVSQILLLIKLISEIKYTPRETDLFLQIYHSTAKGKSLYTFKSLQGLRSKSGTFLIYSNSFSFSFLSLSGLGSEPGIFPFHFLSFYHWGSPFSFILQHFTAELHRPLSQNGGCTCLVTRFFVINTQGAKAYNTGIVTAIFDGDIAINIASVERMKEYERAVWIASLQCFWPWKGRNLQQYFVRHKTFYSLL